MFSPAFFWLKKMGQHQKRPSPKKPEKADEPDMAESTQEDEPEMAEASQGAGPEKDQRLPKAKLPSLSHQAPTK